MCFSASAGNKRMLLVIHGLGHWRLLMKLFNNSETNTEVFGRGYFPPH